MRTGFIHLPAGQQRRRRRAGAYSVVELMMVLVIIALMAGMAIPRYGRSLTRYRAETAARRVAADFALARATARNTSSTQTIDFSSLSNGYTISGITGIDNIVGSSYRVDMKNAAYQCTVTTSLHLLADASVVTKINFDRYGTPDASGTVTVQNGDVQKIITLSGTTGRATVN